MSSKYEYTIYECRNFSSEKIVRCVCESLWRTWWKLLWLNIMIHPYRTEFYVERKPKCQN
jgi:hypothetical protein